jgi:hypothetical protein
MNGAATRATKLPDGKRSSMISETSASRHTCRNTGSSAVLSFSGIVADPVSDA